MLGGACAAALGLDRVLIACLVDNVASARTIERNGGVLEGIRDGEHGQVLSATGSLWTGDLDRPREGRRSGHCLQSPRIPSAGLWRC